MGMGYWVKKYNNQHVQSLLKVWIKGAMWAN